MAKGYGDIGKMVLEQKRLKLDQEKLKFERHRLTLDDYKTTLDRFKAEVDAQKPYVEGVMRFAELAVRSLLILNGGAALALLAFAGNTAARGGIDLLGRVAPVITIFSIGAALGVTTACGAYLAQALFMEAKTNPRLQIVAMGFRYASVLCGCISLMLFLWGMHRSSTAFQPSDAPVILSQAGHVSRWLPKEVGSQLCRRTSFSCPQTEP
jgi:hypothetical protein